MTLPQAQKLLVAVLPLASISKAQVLSIISYHTRRNYVAYKSHRKTRLGRAEKIF